jgi:hypothetical protein
MKTNVLKAGIVGQEEAAVARQRCIKHVSTVMSKHAKFDKLLEAVFSMQSLPRQYSKDLQQSI